MIEKLIALSIKIKFLKNSFFNMELKFFIRVVNYIFICTKTLFSRNGQTVRQNKEKKKNASRVEKRITLIENFADQITFPIHE